MGRALAGFSRTQNRCQHRCREPGYKSGVLSEPSDFHALLFDAPCNALALDFAGNNRQAIHNLHAGTLLAVCRLVVHHQLVFVAFIPRLESLRGVAALTVVAYHVWGQDMPSTGWDAVAFYILKRMSNGTG
jgi:hypothetical protein